MARALDAINLAKHGVSLILAEQLERETAVTWPARKFSLVNDTAFSIIFPVGTHAKTLAKMRNNPLNWRIGDLVSVAAHYGIEVRNDGGSHHVFSHPSVPQAVCVPAHRPIKPVYVRHFVALIDQIKGAPL